MGDLRRWALTLGVLSLAATALLTAPVAAADTYSFTCNLESLTADFADRDALPQNDPPTVLSAKSDSNGGWGPAAAALPPVAAPADAGCDATTWKRERIVATALRYLNEPGNPHALQYRHHHIPAWDPPASTRPPSATTDEGGDDNSASAWAAGRGLDCSNFTAWVYNYGLGIKFSGNVKKQYAGTAGPVGQPIGADGPFQTGDLIFLHSKDDTERASHVVIVVDDDYVIDSRFNAEGVDGVQVRPRQGRYLTAVLGGRRPIA